MEWEWDRSVIVGMGQVGDGVGSEYRVSSSQRLLALTYNMEDCITSADVRQEGISKALQRKEQRDSYSVSPKCR